ncbi:hypothetical protein MTO96_030592 [Rhipicephalus appendiculatus]
MFPRDSPFAVLRCRARSIQSARQRAGGSGQQRHCYTATGLGRRRRAPGWHPRRRRSPCAIYHYAAHYSVATATELVTSPACPCYAFLSVKWEKTEGRGGGRKEIRLFVRLRHLWSAPGKSNAWRWNTLRHLARAAADSNVFRPPERPVEEGKRQARSSLAPPFAPVLRGFCHSAGSLRRRCRRW